MLTSTLIRFLDRLIIADKSFAVTADRRSIVFLSAADAEPRFPSSAAKTEEDGLLFTPAAGSDLIRRFPFGIRFPAEIERRGVEAIEALAYDQALICSCSLARADYAPFEDDFILDDEREATLEAARIYRSTMAEAAPDVPQEAASALLRFALEKPAELSPMTLLEKMLAAGADRVVLFHTPETGTVVADVAAEEERSGVFADYSDVDEAYGAHVTTAGLTGRLVRGFHVTGNTVRVFSEENVSDDSLTGTLKADTLLAMLH